jgi:hypothetical protein
MCKIIFAKYYTRHFLKHLDIKVNDNKMACFEYKLQKIMDGIAKTDKQLLETLNKLK